MDACFKLLIFNYNRLFGLAVLSSMRGSAICCHPTSQPRTKPGTLRHRSEDTAIGYHSRLYPLIQPISQKSAAKGALDPSNLRPLVTWPMEQFSIIFVYLQYLPDKISGFFRIPLSHLPPYGMIPEASAKQLGKKGHCCISALWFLSWFYLL